MHANLLGWTTLATDPGGTAAVFKWNGSSAYLAYYRHSDWVGSSRLASTRDRAVYYDGAYAPYGENYAESGTTDRVFAGLPQNLVTTGAYPLDDALRREYNSTWGRWMSPDPAGMAAADPSNPQTWNRYAYVANNPTNFIDPLGLDSWDPGSQTLTGDMGGNCQMVTPGYIYCSTMTGGSYSLFGWNDLGCVTTGGCSHQQQSNTGGGTGGITVVTKPDGGDDNNPCQVGPLNLSQNIKTSKALSAVFWFGLDTSATGGTNLTAAAGAYYIHLVQTGGPWDPKTTLGPTPENIRAGNVNFGATCSQFGFNTWLGGQICQYGAGIVGKWTGTYGSPLSSPSHGDIPLDNQQIRQGLAKAKKGGC
jgi:RHS repeat-associated protein